MFDRVLNIPMVLNMWGFWIYQGSEYTRFLHIKAYFIHLLHVIPAHQALFDFFGTFSHSKSFKFASSLSGFHLWIVLNLLKYAFFIHSACITCLSRRCLHIPLVLNMPGFSVCRGYTGFWVCLNNSWTSLNMPEYVEICRNVPKSTWVAFALIPHSLFECVVTYFNVYIKLEVLVWRIMRA